MNATLSTLSPAALRNFAAGLGAQKRRWGVKSADALRFALIEYPELRGLEADIKRGWTREDKDLRAA